MPTDGPANASSPTHAPAPRAPAPAARVADAIAESKGRRAAGEAPSAPANAEDLLAMPKTRKPKRAIKGKAKPGKSGGKRSGKAPKLADIADRHVLYQLSVQGVEAEIDFVDDTFKALRGRRPAIIREDFCGTANSSAEFVRRRKTNRAIGVDLDKPTLDWGQQHNIDPLPARGAERVRLIEQDVLTVDTEPVDAVLAMNFSYFIFRTRDVMRRYFERVRDALVDDGVLFLDCYGGSESFAECTDEREIEPDADSPKAHKQIGTFTYIWDQHRYNPIDGEMDCRIHFHFRDGSKLRKAFEYSWRMWTLPELRELLLEAGFATATVYWEGADEDDPEEGNGVFEPTDEGSADPAWVCYIVAEK